MDKRSPFHIKSDPKQLKIREKEHSQQAKQDKKNKEMEDRIASGKGKRGDFFSAESFKSYKDKLKNNKY